MLETRSGSAARPARLLPARRQSFVHRTSLSARIAPIAAEAVRRPIVPQGPVPARYREPTVAARARVVPCGLAASAQVEGRWQTSGSRASPARPEGDRPDVALPDGASRWRRRSSRPSGSPTTSSSRRSDDRRLDTADLPGRRVPTLPIRSSRRSVRATAIPPLLSEDGGLAPGADRRALHPRHRSRLARGGVPRLRLRVSERGSFASLSWPRRSRSSARSGRSHRPPITARTTTSMA